MYLLMTLNKFLHDLNLIMHYLQNEPVIDSNLLCKSIDWFYMRTKLTFNGLSCILHVNWQMQIIFDCQIINNANTY